MLHILFCLLLYSFILQYSGTQAAVELIYMDTDFVNVDTNYFDDIEVYPTEEGTIFINFTIVNYLPADTMFHWDLVGATMGEFKVRTGFDTSLPLCEMMNEPILTRPGINAIGIDECPPGPGIYGSEGYFIDISLLPDEFPPNKYRCVIEFLDGDNILLKLYTYYKIS